ncbi:TadE/TadG family type IV pilus assembly protein, partial [Streptomyces sp. NPDC001880]
MKHAHEPRRGGGRLTRPGRRATALLRRRARGDRGFGSVEFAVLAVVVLALIFTAVQVGLYYHARKVA